MFTATRTFKKTSALLDPQMIRQAQVALRDVVHRTPLVHSAALSRVVGAEVYLKLECLQKTGSFKPRGAFNKLLSLTPAERSQGVVAVSGGNHAQGVAYAARELGIAATIVMPASTPRNYLDATRAYGAEVVLTVDIKAAFAEGLRLQQEGLVPVHPFDDPLVAAGQGTIGLEILEDLPNVNRVYTSIGGGALISGIATALKDARPDVRVVGVQTRGADAMARSLKANQIVELPAITSVARTLGAPAVSEFTLRHVQQLVDDVVVVDDAAAIRALFYLLERTKYLTEPAAACCLAAAERQRSEFWATDQVVLVLCGGNVAVEDLTTLRRLID